jgi:HlyD family secretion protein
MMGDDFVGKDEGEQRWGQVLKAGLALALVVTLAGALGYLLYSQSARPAPVPQTTQLRRTTITRTIIANGTIVPRREVIVKPQISGIIRKIMVDRGDIVKAGDLIAVISPLPPPVDVNTAEVELHNAHIGHQHAREEFERVETLFKRQLVARADYDKLGTELRLAEQRLHAARRHLEIVRTGASAALGRSASEVRATIGGTVLERPVEIGAFVIETNTFNEGTTIVAIADLSNLVFRGKVDEPDAGSIEPGMTTTVRVGAFPGELFEGTIEFIAPKAEERDGVTRFEIRAGLGRKPALLLRAGYSATADIVVARREQVLALTEHAVHFQSGRPYVMVETAPGVFTRRGITLGLSDGITTEILSGLDEHEQVRID